MSVTNKDEAYRLTVGTIGMLAGQYFRKYYKQIPYMNCNDWKQEAGVAASIAYNSYCDGKNCKLNSFVHTCVKRHLDQVVERSNRIKRKAELIPFDEFYGEDDLHQNYAYTGKECHSIRAYMDKQEYECIVNELTDEERKFLDWIIDGNSINGYMVTQGVSRMYSTRLMENIRKIAEKHIYKPEGYGV